MEKGQSPVTRFHILLVKHKLVNIHVLGERADKSSRDESMGRICAANEIKALYE